MSSLETAALMSTFSVSYSDTKNDKHGNQVLSLDVQTTDNRERISRIRYVPTETGPMLAEIDVTMMVTGLNNNAAGG